MRICIIYDCVYPYTVGGAERWYRNLAERLASEGHEVDYLTLRQWSEDERATIPGVNVIAVGPQMALYANGRRRVLPPLRFGVGVFLHLARHGRGYDVVHTASFPYFSLLAASILRPYGYQLVVDWFEIWTRGYWREYLGRVGGDVGWNVQRLCLRVPQRAFCFSRLHAARMLEEGFPGGDPTVLRGLYNGGPANLTAAVQPASVIFAGRHIPEKCVPTLVPALLRTRETVPDLRAVLFGDGPDRDHVLTLIATNGLSDVIEAPGFVPEERLKGAFATALCLALPSRREGYGLVVVEAASHGTPSVLVAGPDNAAVELIEEEVNGTIAASSSPDDLAAAIIRIVRGGAALRASTASWYEEHREELSLTHSLDIVTGGYARDAESARS